jgi:hypothetical protein
MHSPRVSRLRESGSATRRHWSARLSMMWSTNSCGNRGGESEGVAVSVHYRSLSWTDHDTSDFVYVLYESRCMP